MNLKILLLVTVIKPKFVIMAAGFRSGSLAHKNAYESRISIPSLHISGTTDEIIPNEMSRLLEDGFAYATKIHHAGGHYFPATANEKQAYVRFFQDQLQKHLEEKELKNNGVMIDDDEDESWVLNFYYNCFITKLFHKKKERETKKEVGKILEWKQTENNLRRDSPFHNRAHHRRASCLIKLRQIFFVFSSPCSAIKNKEVALDSSREKTYIGIIQRNTP